LCGILQKSDSRFFANVGITDRNGRLLRFGSLAREEEQMGSGADYCGER
jgi:hypothetical protein